jgi:molybdopterin-dependent oxidoreductase alpha subunit
MGGQQGGMRNEAGHWPEVCKKSLQAMAADMQDGLRPEFFRRYGIAELRTLSPRELEGSGRIVQPLHAAPGATHYRVIDWDEAMSRIAAKIKATAPSRSFFYLSGRSSNEAAFILQLFARLYGTNHVNNCSYYCHQASGVGLTESIGTGTATLTLEDVEGADLFFLIGGNPASNHPRLMRTLMTIRRRGGRVIVINPVRETGLVNFRVPSDLRSLLFGTPIASQYLQPHIGGDIALLTGIAKALLDRGATDEGYIRRHTEGWEALRDLLASTDWDAIERASGVARGPIEDAAQTYARAKSVVFGWTMGITHHDHGVENVQWIVNLALMRGMVGRPRAGLLPIRGHSNVQGIGSVGVTPKLKEAIFERLENHFGIKLPTAPGYDTMECLRAAGRGEMKLGVCLGGNLFGSNPDAAGAARALNRVDTMVYLNTTLNTGHAWGTGQETIVLPVLARDEEPQPTTQESMFNFVRLSDGGRPRHAGPRSEVSIIAEIAQRVLGDSGPIDWASMREHHSIRRAMARVVPGFEHIGEIDESRREFHIAGRILHEPTFATPSGRAHFRPHPIPQRQTGNGALRLMTIRSEGQFNTVVYEEEDIYRGQERRDVILLNGEDIRRRGLAPDQTVQVRSEAGRMHGIRVREFDIRPGNALMYYPEANVLVPPRVDPRSKTPAFKSVAIEIEAEAASTGAGRVPLDVIAPRRPMNVC